MNTLGVSNFGSTIQRSFINHNSYSNAHMPDFRNAAPIIIKNYEEGLIDERTFLKSLNILNKGEIDEIKTWGGQDYIKTNRGWQRLSHEDRIAKSSQTDGFSKKKKKKGDDIRKSNNPEYLTDEEIIAKYKREKAHVYKGQSISKSIPQTKIKKDSGVAPINITEVRTVIELESGNDLLYKAIDQVNEFVTDHLGNKFLKKPDYDRVYSVAETLFEDKFAKSEWDIDAKNYIRKAVVQAIGEIEWPDLDRLR